MQPIGYRQLIERFGLTVLPPDQASFLLTSGHRKTRLTEGFREEYYPPRNDPGAAWTDQLTFALKHEGVNLEVLAALFQVVPVAELTAWVEAAPTSRYTRVAWFLYEWLTGNRLPLPDLKQGNYVPVLNPESHYALAKGKGAAAVQRQRVENNLPGPREYCPLIRRTEKLKQFEALQLDQLAITQVKRFPAEQVYRASQYLYIKETKSSYAIEHLTPDQRRTARFVALLQQAGGMECVAEPALVRLQNAIVEERYAAKRFRDFQNYVGQSLGPARELVHYIPPKPTDLPALMAGWATCVQALEQGGVHPVVTATVAGFGFVFLHPFDDGNGRLHRFLIHHALAAGRFGPPGLLFPVSATMLKQINRYDAALEAYSKKIGREVEYRLEEQGNLAVTNETAAFYRYPDLTTQAEALFSFIEDTIHTELVAELEYLAVFDQARRDLRQAVDMPDRRLDLFLRVCLQGKGALSKNKRAQFQELTDTECTQMETIVRAAIVALPAATTE
jgi:hypothetical protein